MYALTFTEAHAPILLQEYLCYSVVKRKEKENGSLFVFIFLSLAALFETITEEESCPWTVPSKLYFLSFSNCSQSSQCVEEDHMMPIVPGGLSVQHGTFCLNLFTLSIYGWSEILNISQTSTK